MILRFQGLVALLVASAAIVLGPTVLAQQTQVFSDATTTVTYTNLETFPTIVAPPGVVTGPPGSGVSISSQKPTSYSLSTLTGSLTKSIETGPGPVEPNATFVSAGSSTSSMSTTVFTSAPSSSSSVATGVSGSAGATSAARSSGYRQAGGMVGGASGAILWLVVGSSILALVAPN
ncbi:hypothetical protein T439DRAFT_323413 [Meredithblackwellia eburnea MCA 4105]